LGGAGAYKIIFLIQETSLLGSANMKHLVTTRITHEKVIGSQKSSAKIIERL
jgi:hypothetical protein